MGVNLEAEFEGEGEEGGYFCWLLFGTWEMVGRRIQSYSELNFLSTC